MSWSRARRTPTQALNFLLSGSEGACRGSRRALKMLSMVAQFAISEDDQSATDEVDLN